MRTSQGLTLIEVLAAMTILAVVVTAFSASVVSTFDTTRQMGDRTDANTVLGFFGRMAAGGAGKPLTYSPAEGKKVYAYGSLKTAFPELASGDTKIKDPNLYRVTVTSPGTVTIGSIQVYQYNTQVCWRDGTQDACINGLTAGPLASPTEQVVN